MYVYICYICVCISIQCFAKHNFYSCQCLKIFFEKKMDFETSAKCNHYYIETLKNGTTIGLSDDTKKCYKRGQLKLDLINKQLVVSHENSTNQKEYCNFLCFYT